MSYLLEGAMHWGAPGGAVAEDLLASAGGTGDTSSVPGSGRSPGGGNSNPLQDSCQDNPVDRGAWWVIDHALDQTGPFTGLLSHSCGYCLFTFNSAYLLNHTLPQTISQLVFVHRGIPFLLVQMC